MLSYPHRSLFALSLLLLSLACCLADAPAPKPTPKQIAQWVEQLGDNSFTMREDASKKLWQAGAAAEFALEQAVKSDDAEVVRRARELLDKFRWGIYPDTPADIVALIRAYQSSAGNARRETLQRLLDSGDAGLRAVLKIARAEKDVHQRNILRDLVAGKLPAAFLQAVTEEKYEKFEQLLELGHEGQFLGQTQYAAYWLLRGKLAERIAHVRGHLREHPDDKWSAQTLAYLHRANGDLVEARKAAEKSENAELIEGILYELGDWKALAARAESAAKEKPGDKGTHHIAGATNPAEAWGHHAAFARLAGKQKEFENAVRELRKFTPDTDRERQTSAYVAAKALLLNDRPMDGLDLLAKTKNDAMLIDLLCTRLDFRKVLDLPDAPQPALMKTPADLGFYKARTLYSLGEKEEAKKHFSRLAEYIKNDVDAFWVVGLLHLEYRGGLKELAFEHCAKVLGVSPRKNIGNADGAPLESSFLGEVFPEQRVEAELWWIILRQKFKEESSTAVLNRVRDVLEGKLAAKEVKAWIEEAGAVLSQPNAHIHAKRLPLYRQALAETAFRAGLDEVAASLLEKADTLSALLRWGDLLAAKKQWTKAAERYQQAWKKALVPPAPRPNFRPIPGPPDPLPLYLAGDALVHAGQEKEGKKLIEQSHWILLADAGMRFTFFLALGKRGHIEGSQREADLLLRVSEPNSYYSGEALRRRAIAALKRKEYLQAAEGFEQSMLRCLRSGTSFVSNAAYANVPAQIHLLRARGLLAEEKLDEALKQADLALTASPGYVNLPIELVPELERRGHKKEAAALFERCQAAYEKVCRAYPRCAWAHNSAAWMSACCRRNLDKALQHAEKAVELAPANAGYLDTLAEVHFQRGDKDKAIALQKRAIELDPKKTYFRRQLKRLEAGDPSAERPPENDEE